MSLETKIDLAYFFNPDAPIANKWEFGEKRALALPLKHLRFTLDCLLKQTSAEWILFWDYSIGEPDTDLIKELIAKPVDVWHSGLKLGTGGLPQILDYISPTWMYNKDASSDLEHTSFRVSMKACLIRTSVLKAAGNIPGTYSSLEMSGLALGYELFKKGAVMRYHPNFVKNIISNNIDIPEKDDWVFAKEFFPVKWQIWSLINKPGIFRNYKYWRATKGVKAKECKPILHSSVKQNSIIPAASVSVLVPTLDRYNYLINELEQLSVQTVLPCEVLITDQTKEGNRIKIDFDRYENLNIRYFPQSENGQCVAWNKLLEEAKGEFVLFLGDDADGIKPDFIEQLLLSRNKFESDMVASNVIELGINYKEPNQHYYMSDTFPITLIRRSLLLQTGFMDMFFNKNIRADHDLAMRCHLKGSSMIFDSSAQVYHHRAPAGGLRAHNARVVTSYMAKNSITKFLNPTSSEIYLALKYFNKLQVKNYIKIKYLNQLFIKGSILKKLLRLSVFILKYPLLYKQYKVNKREALAALSKNGVDVN